MQSKRLYRSCAGIHFYRTENEIWAGFGPVGNTEKKPIEADYYFEGSFFMFSWTKVRTEKLHKNLKKINL